MGGGFFMKTYTFPFPMKDQIEKGILNGFVPKHLNIQGKRELNIFPYNVLFARYKVENGKTIMGSAIYEPEIKSYKKTGSLVSMKYVNAYVSTCWLQIDYDESKKTYRGEKFVKGKSVGFACGVSWDIFFVHFTALGLSNGERCEFEVCS